MDWLIGLLSPLRGLLERIWKRARRPSLRIYYDAGETYHTRRIQDAGGCVGFFCHVMVQNTGKSVARACRARLIAVEAQGNSREFAGHPDFKNPVVLKWGHEPDFDPRDVEHDLPRRLDLCYVIEPAPDVLRFFTEKRPSGNRTDFPRGVYHVTIRVDAENAGPVDGQFLVTHTGAWNQVKLRGV